MIKSKIYEKYNFVEILQKYNYCLHSGNIVAGVIMFKESSGFLVNIGDNFSGYLPQEEINKKFIRTERAQNQLIYLTRDFFIVKYNLDRRQYILSIKRLEYIRSWKRIKQLEFENCMFYLKINYINKGGLITNLEGLQAFVPKSQIYANDYIKSYRNKKVICKILIINEHKNQLVLTAKSPLIHLSKHKLRPGEILYGTITKVKTYGLFIKIYKIIALLHISEIGFEYIDNIHKVFCINKLIKIRIIHIDSKQGRISVSKRKIKTKFN
uniref:Ribosomal protein S1 n=1 Tax=Platysiphonia delicata TaxID=2006979 RepID=A0A1Z1M0T9_9FLOR|nr:ribosomal protein S1 [Platysiphonia delicata]ARW59679.1 ribosomal protein S1 [Platysiphonia delicata]